MAGVPNGGQSGYVEVREKGPRWTLAATHPSKYHRVSILVHQQRYARDFFEAKAAWRLVFRALHNVSVALAGHFLPFAGGFAHLEVDHRRLQYETHNGIIWRARFCQAGMARDDAPAIHQCPIG